MSVPKEPVSEDFIWRQILEYRNLAKEPQLKGDFENAIKRYQAMRSKQAEERNRLKVVELKTADHITVENRILMRIAREKGIDIARLVGDEYQPLKEIVSEERRIKFLEDLDKNFFTEWLNNMLRDWSQLFSNNLNNIIYIILTERLKDDEPQSSRIKCHCNFLV